jgi:3-oxoacyl-[acyl-carrier-protein] synthase III
MRESAQVTRAGAFATAFGEVRRIDELDVPEPDRAGLGALGLAHFTRCDRDALVASMREAAAASLAGVDLDEVDRVVLATSDFVQATDRECLPRLADELRLRRATPLGVSQGFCTNFSLAFEVVQALLAAGRAHCVLFVTADRYWSDSARVLRNRAGLGSDGAGACVLRRGRGPGFELRGIGHAWEPSVVHYGSPARLIDYVRAYSTGFARACKEALVDADVGPIDCAALVTPHFAPQVLKNLVELSGMEPSRLFSSDRARHGHCNSADQIGALGQLETALPPGAIALVTGAGEGVWGAVVARRVAEGS